MNRQGRSRDALESASADLEEQLKQLTPPAE